MRAKERANANSKELVHMAKEGALFAETRNKKYIQFKDYIIVLGKQKEYEYTIVTLMYSKWFEDGQKMQEQIDRHL